MNASQKARLYLDAKFFSVENPVPSPSIIFAVKRTVLAFGEMIV